MLKAACKTLDRVRVSIGKAISRDTVSAMQITGHERNVGRNHGPMARCSILCQQGQRIASLSEALHFATASSYARRMTTPQSKQSTPLSPRGYSHRLLARSRGLRIVWIVLGWMALLAGLIGIFLPVLPTTPFILLSAACFARGSARFYFWLYEHRVFGPVLQDWQNHRAIPLRAKQLGIGMMWVSMAFSAYLFRENTPVLVALMMTAIIVTIILLRIPTRR
jgi:uncharacterized membrane protein YbaN (DUF454 family)